MFVSQSLLEIQLDDVRYDKYDRYVRYVRYVRYAT